LAVGSSFWIEPLLSLVPTDALEVFLPKIGDEKKPPSLERMEGRDELDAPLVRRAEKGEEEEEVEGEEEPDETVAALLEKDAEGREVDDDEHNGSPEAAAAVSFELGESSCSIALSPSSPLVPSGWEVDMAPLRDENGAASRSGVSGGERAWRTEPDAGRDRVSPSKNERPGMFCIGCGCSP